MKYSNTTQSFYAPELDYPAPPADLIEVSDADYKEAITARSEGKTIAFVDGALVITTPAPIVPTQAELDLARYSKRAAAKDQIMAEFAAENIARVRAGVWTVPQLIELTQDAQLIGLLGNINTLSYEIALGTIDGLSNPLITPEIKSGWKAKLQSHFY